jgi:hypothetical protein
MARKIFVPKKDQVAIVASLLNMAIILGGCGSLGDNFDSLSDYRLLKKNCA